MFHKIWRRILEGPREVDGDFYCRQYPDVAGSYLGPYYHYAHHGRYEGRAPNERIWNVRVYGFWKGRWRPLTKSGPMPVVEKFDWDSMAGPKRTCIELVRESLP
jgi:hypothetical protein